MANLHNHFRITPDSKPPMLSIFSDSGDQLAKMPVGGDTYAFLRDWANSLGVDLSYGVLKNQDMPHNLEPE